MADWIIMQSEGNCDLFPFYFFVEPWAKRLKPILGKNIDMLMLIKQGHLKECVKQKQYEEIGKIVFNKIMKENFFPVIMNKTDFYLKQVEDFTEKIENKDFSKHLNKELAEEFNEYCELIFDLNVWGMMITLMEYAKSSYVSDALKDYLEGHFKKHGISEPTPGIIAVLSTPSNETYLRKQKREAVKLAIELEKNQSIKKLFKEKNEKQIIESLTLFYPEEFNKILDLRNRFCWIAYGYQGPALELDYFVLELKNLLNKLLLESVILHHLRLLLVNLFQKKKMQLYIYPQFPLMIYL